MDRERSRDVSSGRPHPPAEDVIVHQDHRSLPEPASLAWLAVDNDDPGPLIAAAQASLGEPLALAGDGGEVLAHAPDDAGGRRAAEIARAAAVKGLRAPPGWTIVAVGTNGGRALGFLAARVAPAAGDEDLPGLLALLAPLVAEQLRRRRLLERQRDALLRRLVTDPRADAQGLRGDAAAVGLRFAGAYWPAVVFTSRRPLSAALLDGARAALRPPAADCHSTVLDGCLILLHPDGPEAEVGGAGWARAVVDGMRAAGPAALAQAVVADAPAPVGASLPAAVAELLALARLTPRVDPERAVASRRQHALDRLLLRNVEARAARRFVRDQIGSLIDWDREHHSDLLGVLEASLDHPRHDEAARRCFMHRNTFRHRVRQIDEVLGEGRLDDPDVRLAVRVAIKLHRLAATRGAGAPVGDRVQRLGTAG